MPLGQAIWFGATAVWAVFSLLNTPYPALAPLQNLPTLLIVFGLVLIARRTPLPTSAVACACMFLMLHALGGRYIYSNVPYDAWAQELGLPQPDTLLALKRNSYDRLVHFSFGLLWVHPISAWLSRRWVISVRLSTYIAVEFVLAGSAVYEIFEWLLTILMAGPNADAYNGQQGDIWDAQKDMACAGTGAFVATTWLQLTRWFASKR
jgi:putative membrane protein